MPTEEATNCGWVKLYHPRGPLVTLPILATVQDFAAMAANVSAALDAGFSSTAPGLEQGEHRFECSAVIRRSKTNRDDSESPVIDLYEHGNEFKTLTIYLDSDEEVRAFEYAAKLRLQDIPLLAASAAPKRGDNKQTDKYFHTPAKPFGVVFRPNPDYDEAKAAAATQANPYKVAKRVFERWVDQRPAPADAESGKEPASAPVQPTDEQVLATWDAFLRSDPPVSTLNKRIADVIPSLKEDLKKRVWQKIKSHAASCNLAWDQDRRGYTPVA